MSRPVLSSAARRLSRQPSTTFSVPHCQRSFSTSQPALNLFSASSDTPVSPRSIRSPFHTSKNSRLARYNTRRADVSRFTAPRQRAAFSSSSFRPATHVIQNAKNDEEGKPLMVDISSRAAERLRQITDPSSSPSATKEENPYHHLRITVTSGGCHGFQYMMSLEPASKIDGEEDTIFKDEQEQGQEASAPGEALVIMDEPSLELLSGSTVDYTTELIGSQFTIVNNPRATSNCGCGTSFDVND